MNEDFLHKKLEERESQNAYRRLRLPDGKTDFCSNDYLGIATNGLIERQAAGQPRPGKPNGSSPSPPRHGSTGSRLLAGNYLLIEQAEQSIARFHEAEAGLIFNSGYDANLGLLSAVPQRGDTILYDHLSHASIRDGIRLSFASSSAFLHNDLPDLEKKLRIAPPAGQATGGNPANLFVVTESVFSMDGDQAPLQEITALCERYGARLVVDEAHATGVTGAKGEGLVQALGLQTKCFARVHTFGKALGCHGAIILGSEALRDYLINFSRPFIYTTALPETSILAIQTAYALLPGLSREREQVQRLIGKFRHAGLGFQRIHSSTPIQAVIVPGNEEVKKLAGRLQDNNLDIRPILYPTVPKGSERLRIVLHSFNTPEEVQLLLHLLQ